MTNPDDLRFLEYNQDMKENTELIVDEGCFEIYAKYDYCRNDEEVMEGERKPYLVGLKSVEVVVCGVGIDILPRLNNLQRNKIIEMITFG